MIYYIQFVIITFKKKILTFNAYLVHICFMRIFQVILLITLSATCLSCAGLRNIEVGDIEDVNLSRVAGSTIEFEVLMPIENPSGFRLRIADVDLDFYINNEYVGKISNVENVLIPSRSSEIYTFQMRVEFSNILKGAISMYNFFLDREAEIMVQGKLSVRSFPFNRSVPVEEKTILRLD